MGDGKLEGLTREEIKRLALAAKCLLDIEPRLSVASTPLWVEADRAFGGATGRRELWWLVDRVLRASTRQNLPEKTPLVLSEPLDRGEPAGDVIEAVEEDWRRYCRENGITVIGSNAAR